MRVGLTLHLCIISDGRASAVAALLLLVQDISHVLGSSLYASSPILGVHGQTGINMMAVMSEVLETLLLRLPHCPSGGWQGQCMRRHNTPHTNTWTAAT